MRTSGNRLTRTELYDLAWSEPIKKLAERFGVSDVAVAKVCRQMYVPVPGRGYWARRTAGKPVIRISLPLRPPGLSEIAIIGGGLYAPANTTAQLRKKSWGRNPRNLCSARPSRPSRSGSKRASAR